MKLIFTSYSSSPEFNQPEVWLKRIEAYTGILECLGKSHTVIGIERINYEGKFHQNGVQYYFIKLKKKEFLFPWQMHRLIKQLKPDVVFVNGFIFPLQIVQLKLKLGRRVKIIVLHRAERPSKGLKKYLQMLADKYVDAYLFTSIETGKQWIENGNIADLKKIYEVIQASSVFYPGEKSIARSALAINGLPVFLWLGRLDANKDPLTVLKAFLQFIQFQPNAKLYMIYQAEELLPEVMQLAKTDAKALDAIKFVGKVPHDQLQAWYNSADFIISGSHYEGSGVAVCEAMSCGCIPIVTNIPSFSKMTGPGKCGFIYEAGNDRDLLALLLKTMQIDLEKERAKVLQQFQNEISFEAIARKVNNVIESI